MPLTPSNLLGAPRYRIGALPVDRVDLAQAVAQVIELARGVGGTVFTPNVDHVCRAQSDALFAQAYDACALAVADGTPVVWASHLMGTPLPEKVAGSRLLPPVLRGALAAGLSVYLLGGRPGAAVAALKRCGKIPGDRFWVGPPTQAVRQNEEATLAQVEADLKIFRPQLVCVSLSSPLQETWSHAVQRRLQHGAFLCTGSAIDILAGMLQPAPTWMARSGLEWFYRLVHEPRRLARRYLITDRAIAGILYRQWRELRRKR